MKLHSKDAIIVVVKSLKHLEVYLNIKGRVVGGVSTKDKDFTKLSGKDKIDLLAQKFHKIAADNKVTSAVFQRNGNIYTGKIKMLADAIREKGIKI